MSRINNRIKNLQEDIYKDYMQSKQSDYDESNQRDIQPHMQQHMQPPPSNLYYQDRAEEAHGFGDTRDSVKIAKEIENNPTPPGVCEVLIGGRPIDLHMFEDYMVWRISPYQMRTVLRYRTGRIMEEIKNYSSSPKAKMKGNMIILIAIAAVFLIIGLMVLMYMPQLTEMFKGFI